MVTIRNTAIIALLFLVGACVKLGHIQQREPVRTMNFTGSHKAMAQCIHQRLGGKVQDESFGNAYVVYNSAKGSSQQDGISHYSVTVAQTGPDQGTASLRLVFVTETFEMRQRRLQRAQSGQKEVSPVQIYWIPVQACAAQAKSTN